MQTAVAAVPVQAKGPESAASAPVGEQAPWIEMLYVARTSLNIQKDEDRKRENAAGQLRVDGVTGVELEQRLAVLEIERQSNAARRIKAIEFEICEAWIRHHYPSPAIADQLIALRNSVDHQKDVAERSFWRNYRWQRGYQWLLVLFGFAATILSAWASRDTPAKGAGPVNWGVTKSQTFSFFAMVLTAGVTAMGALANFYDAQGSVEMHARVWNAMGELQSRIDDQLMIDAAANKTEETNARIKPWIEDRNKALRQASEAWTNTLKGK